MPYGSRANCVNRNLNTCGESHRNYETWEGTFNSQTGTLDRKERKKLHISQILVFPRHSLFWLKLLPHKLLQVSLCCISFSYLVDSSNIENAVPSPWSQWQDSRGLGWAKISLLMQIQLYGKRWLKKKTPNKQKPTKNLSSIILNITGKCHNWIPLLQFLAIMMNHWVVLCFGVPGLKGLSWQLCCIFT